MRQASLSLLAGLVGDLFAGLVLAQYASVLLLVPGLIALLPAANALRGNIYAPFGSRLGTYLHTGLLRPRLVRSKVLDQNLLAVTAQSLVMSFLLSVLSWTVAQALGIKIVGLENLVFIATVSGVVAGVVLSVGAFVLSSVAFKRGFDPDNVNAPLITAGGDLLSALLLVGLGGGLLAVDFNPALVWPVDIAALGATAWLVHRTWSLQRPIARQIFRQSLPVLVATVALELLTGLVLEANLDNLAGAANAAYLILIPPMLADGGNLASIHSSRLSSAMHLGITRLGRRPDAFAMADIRDMAGVGMLVFPAIGVLVFITAALTGVAHPGFLGLVGVSAIAGAAIIALVLPLGYYTTVASFKLGADPDNVVIPITNSVIDVVGVVVLLGVATLIGGL